MRHIQTEVAILGGGPAGYIAALRAAQLGMKVTLIEEKALGGVCLNVGCIPTKAFLSTSRLISRIHSAKDHGIDCELQGIDWAKAVARKDRIVRSLGIGVEQLLQASNINIVSGRGQLISPREIIAITAEGDVAIQCNKLILATGSSPQRLDIPGADLPGVLTSSDMLGITELPSSLVILGAGVIGLEFASIFAAAGVKVTLIERGERLLPDEDEYAANELLKLMKRQGIAFRMGAEVQDIVQQQEAHLVRYRIGEREQSFQAEKVLLAVGRKLNSDIFSALPLVIQNEAIVVNQHMETNILGVYAAGDVVGGKLLAHLAFAEGRVAAENAAGLKRSMNYKAVPSCIYTNPEYASVGLTEAEAKRQDIQPIVGIFSFRNNSRALTLGEREGFVKVVADQNEVIIGAQILGAEASEMISEMTLAVTLGVKAEVLAEMIHPHPALNEAIWEACSMIIKQPIHML